MTYATMHQVRAGGLGVLAALVGGAAHPGPGAPAQADAPHWRIVWSDEFDGDALDREKWAPEVSCWGGGNDERQCYTDRSANIEVAGGVLRLTGRPEEHTGPAHPPELAHLGREQKTQNYTSGKVRTRGLADWRYGRISARMKLPKGQGAWPAFWMMPAEDVYGRWPLSGEIDIMEAVNQGTPCQTCKGAQEHRTSGALHFGEAWPDNTYLMSYSVQEGWPGPSDEWRVYSVEWAEGVIQWFVDDIIFMRLTSDQWRTASPAAQGRAHAPFDQSFYVMLNLAVGGRLPEEINGAGFDPSAFPAVLEVDWVRVEQCLGDEAVGRACLSDQTWNGEPKGPWEDSER